MAGLKQARANAILDSELRGGSRWLALYTAAPTATANGTEVSGGSYARQPITFDAASGGATQNSATVTFPAATAPWGTIVAWAIVDASSGGNQRTWKTISPISVGTGGVVRFQAGALDVTLA